MRKVRTGRNVLGVAVQLCALPWLGAEWSAVGLWAVLHLAVLQRLQAIGELDWSRAVIDSIQLRAEKGAT